MLVVSKLKGNILLKTMLLNVEKLPWNACGLDKKSARQWTTSNNANQFRHFFSFFYSLSLSLSLSISIFARVLLLSISLSLFLSFFLSFFLSLIFFFCSYLFPLLITLFVNIQLLGTERAITTLYLPKQVSLTNSKRTTICLEGFNLCILKHIFHWSRRRKQILEECSYAEIKRSDWLSQIP